MLNFSFFINFLVEDLQNLSPVSPLLDYILLNPLLAGVQDVLALLNYLFQGEDLIESSSQLIHQGEAIRVTSGMWTNNIVLFLFDHQLVYCKKVSLLSLMFVQESGCKVHSLFCVRNCKEAICFIKIK